MALGRDFRNAGALTVYDPRPRPAANSRFTPPAPRRTVAPAMAGGSPVLAKVNQAVQRRARGEPPPQREEDDGWGRGLGVIFNNPLSRNVLKPFEALDYGRRALTLGVEELAEAIGGRELSTQVDPETGELLDTRSNWEKLNDPTYGIGQLLPDVSWDDSFGNIFDKGVGFVGDVALDPLTYLTAGVGGVAGKAGRALYATRAQNVGRQLAEEALERGASSGEVSKILNRYDKASEQIGRLGPGVIKDDELLTKIGLQKQGLRFGAPMSPGKGFRLGGQGRAGDALGKVARGSNRAAAEVRARFYDRFPRVAKWRTPEGLERAHEVVRSGKAINGLKYRPALALITYHDGVRQGSKSFAGEFAPEFDRISKGLSGDEARMATSEAERAGVTTEWNEFGDLLYEAAKAGGVEFPHRANYVPHIWTQEGVDFLRRNEPVRNALNLTRRDLDDPSGVTLSRKISGGVKQIGDEKIDFGTGTIDEINAVLRDRFGVKQALDDNITSIYGNYIHKLSQDVGVMQGMDDLTKNFADLVVDDDDPADVMRVFQDIVDDAATDTANKEAAQVWQSRLARARKMSGIVEKEVAQAVEGGRSILEGRAGEQIDSLRHFRDETRKQIRDLEKSERSALRRRDKLTETIEGEIESYSDRIVQLQREIRGLEAQEAAQVSVFEDVIRQESPARSQQRATRTSARKRELRALQAEYLEEMEQLTVVGARLRSLEFMEDLVGRRLGSEEPMPRPLPGVEPRTTQGESYLELAGGEAELPYRGIGDLDRMGTSADYERALNRADVVPGSGDPTRLDIDPRAAEKVEAQAERARQAAWTRYEQDLEAARVGELPVSDVRYEPDYDALRQSARASEELRQAQARVREFDESPTGRKLAKDTEKLQQLEVDLSAANSRLEAASEFVEGQHANGRVKWRKVNINDIGNIPGAQRGDTLIDALNRASGGGARNVAQDRAAREAIKGKESELRKVRGALDAAINPKWEDGTPRTLSPGSIERAQEHFGPRIAQLEEEISELQQRSGAVAGNRYDKARIQKEYTAAARDKRRIERQINDINERVRDVRASRQRLENSASRIRERVQRMQPEAAGAQPRRTPPPTEAEAARRLDAALRAVDNEERVLLRQVSAREGRSGTYQPAPGRVIQSDSPVALRRTRLPSKKQVNEDLRALRRSGKPYQLPSDKTPSGRKTRSKRILNIRKAVTDRNTVFQYNTGNRSLPAIAEEMLGDTARVRPYRRMLIESGALPLEAANDHLNLIREVRDAMANLKTASVVNSEVSPTAARSRLSAALGDLRRANEFMVKYGRVIEAGEEPSEALARRMLAPIVQDDIEQLTRQIDAMKSKPDEWIDEEVEYYVDLIQDAVIQVDNAYTSQQQMKAAFDLTTDLSPAHEMAQKQAIVDVIEQQLIPLARKNRGKHRAAFTRAYKKGDAAAMEKASRSIARNDWKLNEDYPRTLARLNERIEELRFGDMSLDMKVLISQIEQTGIGELNEQTRKALSQIFGGDVADQLYRWGRAHNIKGAEKLRDSAEFQKFLRSLFAQAGMEKPEAMAKMADQYMVRTPDGKLTNRPVQDAIISAAKLAYLEQYRTAAQALTEAFDALGLRVGTEGSSTTKKMAAVGYKNGRYNKKATRRIVKEMFESRRGRSNYDYALNEMEMRRARMQTVVRGLGRKERASGEILRMSTDTKGSVAARGPVGQYEQLPDLAESVDEAIAADVLPAERTRRVAQAQKREPLQAAREARNEIRDQMEPGRDDFVSVQSALFDRSATPRPTEPIERARGEQFSRGLKASQSEINRPSGAFTRGSPAAQERELRQLLSDIDLATEATEARLRNVGERAESLRQYQQQVQGSMQDKARRAAEIEGEIASDVGTPLVPEAEDAMRRVRERTAEQTGPRYEEVGQLEVARDAGRKALDTELPKLDTEVARTRETIRAASTEERQIVAKLNHANEVAANTRKTRTNQNLRAEGPAAVAEDFEKVMGDLGLDEAEAATVRGLMADAVELDGRKARWDRISEIAEEQLAKAKANELRTVTESVLLPNWTEMADQLVRGADDATRYYMAQDLARHFTTLTKQMETGRFWQGVEAYTAFFKTYATMRPDFHIRNAISAMFMNGTDGVPVRNNFAAMRAWAEFRRTPGSYLDKLRANPKADSGRVGLTNEQLADAFEAALGSGAGGQFSERGVGPGLRRKQLTSKALNNPATRLSRKAGEYVEGPVRLAMAMDSIANGEDVRGALTRISRIHFDYADVSEMDRYAKRFIPFWTFMSRNLPMQLMQMFQKPRWYAASNSFVRNLSGQSQANAPEYWEEQGGFPLPAGMPGVTQLYSALGGDPETPLYWLPDLAHSRIESDINDITGLLTMEDPGKMLTSLNPLFTVPMELAFEKDLFTDRAYRDTDVRKLGGLERLLEPALALVNRSEGGVVKEQDINAMRALVPFWDTLARAAPGWVSGNESQLDIERRPEMLMRRSGINIRALTPTVEANQVRSQMFDEMDRQAMERALLEAQAGG